MAYRLDAPEPASIPIDNRRGQCRQRTGSAGHEYAAFLCLRIEFRNADNKIAAVGQIQIIRTRRNCRARHSVVLTLKRPYGMDDGIDAKLQEPVTQRWVVRVDSNAAARFHSQRSGKRCGLDGVTSADQ